MSQNLEALHTIVRQLRAELEWASRTGIEVVAPPVPPETVEVEAAEPEPAPEAPVFATPAPRAPPADEPRRGRPAPLRSADPRRPWEAYLPEDGGPSQAPAALSPAPAAPAEPRQDSRRDAEPARRDAEPARRDAEPDRRDAEPDRRDAEPPRRDPEPARRDAEPPRRDPEPPRRDAEPRRDVEPARRNADPARRDAEPVRRAAEPDRRDAEPARRYAEPARRDDGPARRDAEPARRYADPARRDDGPARRDAEPLRASPSERARSPERPAAPSAARAAAPGRRVGDSRMPILQRELDQCAELSDIEEVLGECVRCKLHSLGRQKIVFGVGNPNADIMFVGEGPGGEEDRVGEPFVGKAGQLLTKIIEAGMGMRRDDVYIANIVKCRPPQNRDPEPDEVEGCEPFLLAQIRVIRPKAIIALGKYASHTLLRSRTPITRLRGQWGQYNGIPLMPTFHPAYLLRNPAEKRPVWADIQEVMRFLEMPFPDRGGR